MKTTKIVTLFAVLMALLGLSSLPVSAGGPPKVTICHVDGSGGEHTLSVGIPAAIGHVLHHEGDYYGECDGRTTPPDDGGDDVCPYDDSLPIDSDLCVPGDGEEGDDVGDDNGSAVVAPVWMPSGIETQSMRVVNPEWLVFAAQGDLYYGVYWVNQWGVESPIEECFQPVSAFGDMSCVLEPGSVDGVFVLYTYVFGPDLFGLVQINWVDGNTDTTSYVEYDTTNLGERILGGYEYAPIPDGFFVNE